MKKLFGIFVCLLMFIQTGFANEISVNIKPAYKISTSNVNLHEGDVVDFIISDDVFVDSKKVLKKGRKVTATITSLDDNDILAKPASVYIENFHTYDVGGHEVVLSGIIFKKGNEHRLFTDWVITDWIRGGEVQLLPENDNFVLYLKDVK